MKAAAAVLSALLLVTHVLPAGAQQDKDVLKGYLSNVDKQTRDILRDEIELEKFNLRYRVNAARAGRFKFWRYFGMQELALALFEANNVTTLCYRGENINNPQELKTGASACTTALPAFLGFACGGVGDALELSLNVRQSYQRDHTPYGQRQSAKLVAEKIKNIDEKIAQRQKMLQDGSDEQSSEGLSKVHSLEGDLLVDMRDQAIAEFERFHTAATRNQALENTFYLLDISKASTGCVWTGLALYLFSNRRGRIETAVGILDLVNAASVMIDPMAARLVSRIAANRDHKFLMRNGLPSVDPSAKKLQDDLQRLEQLAQSESGTGQKQAMTVFDRLEHYRDNANYFKEQLRMSADTIRESKRTLIEHLGWGLFVGGSKVPLGVLSTEGGSRFPYREGVINNYYFAGTLAYTPAVTLTILDSWRRQIKAKRTFNRLKQEGKLPTQLINNRIGQLDSFENRLPP